jgi:hypothetical protein
VRNEINEVFIQRLSARDARRSSVMSSGSQRRMQTAKMLYQEGTVKYTYDSTFFWSALESTRAARLFRAALEKVPHILEARKKWESAQKAKRLLAQQQTEKTQVQPNGKKKRSGNKAGSQIGKKILEIGNPTKGSIPGKVSPYKNSPTKVSTRKYSGNSGTQELTEEQIIAGKILHTVMAGNLLPKVTHKGFKCEIDEGTIQALLIIAMDQCAIGDKDGNDSKLFKT